MTACQLVTHEEGQIVQTLSWQFDESVRDRVRAWAVEVEGVVVRDGGGAFAEPELGRRLGELHRGGLIGGIEGIGEARRLYKAFGVDPTRTRPSSEALLRRCMKGQDLYRINEAVDVGNWVSLEFLLPLGLYDRGRIVGEHALIRTGSPGEEFAGIRKGPVHVAGRLCVSDREGAFGSPTSDSLRTCVTEATASLCAVVFGPADGDPRRLEAAGRALGARLASYCKGSLIGEGAVGP